MTLRVCLFGGVAGVQLVIVGAHPLLHVFGAQYAARAAMPLAVMTAGYFGSVLKNHHVALLRIHDEVTKATVFATVTCAVRLVALVAGALAGGLVGVSVALLVVMSAAGRYAIPALRNALHGEPATTIEETRAPVIRLAGFRDVTWFYDEKLSNDLPEYTGKNDVGLIPLLREVLTGRTRGAGRGGAQPVMAVKATRTQTNVVYFLQTHSRPAQIARLVQVITAGSPDAIVLISHDVKGPTLDVARLEALGNVHVLLEPGGYGDFSHLDRYFAAVDWLDANGIDYDWLENLTGQDYPLRPIAEIEDTLAATDTDGFLLYSPVFPERVPRDADQGTAGYTLVRAVDATMRYDYRHWRLGRPTAAKKHWMRPLMALNFVQPWLRVSNSYASVGVRRRTVFGSGFHCYGGSFFCTLRAECVRYVRDYARANPDMVAYFRDTLAPEEVFLHSVLVNSGRFSLTPDYKRYIDWTGCTHTHPRTLGIADLNELLVSDAHWARKLDLGKDAKLFDILDQRIRRGPRTLGGYALTEIATICNLVLIRRIHPSSMRGRWQR